LKANFHVNEDNSKSTSKISENKDISEAEFEDFVEKAGAAGSFMIFRSDKNQDDELGLEQI
jgi:hypothetical protein